MNEVRVTERSELDAGTAGDGRNDAPMVMAIEMAMAVNPIAVVTVGAATLEPMERNKNGKRRRWSKAPATIIVTGGWSSRMELKAQQRAPELAQLPRTISKMANKLEVQTEMQETQWLRLKM
jgi:hypothetical protein